MKLKKICVVEKPQQPVLGATNPIFWRATCARQLVDIIVGRSDVDCVPPNMKYHLYSICYKTRGEGSKFYFICTTFLLE